MSAIVEVWRGAMVESRHRLSVAVAGADGHLRASAGDPDLPVFARSAVKPFQALPLVEDGVADRLGLTDAELALCCGSHNGEDRHVEAARSILRKAGAREELLACGPHPPLGAAAARALEQRGVEPARIHNNCSGKHAGMLALARVHGWALPGYERPEHPVQERVLQVLAGWTGIAAQDIPRGTDGCGVPTFGLPLGALARAFGQLARAARSGDREPARVVDAMVRNPEYVAGTGRLCTDLMRVSGGRVFAKVGAEGVYCAGVPGAELGIALKVEDGATRAAEPALLAVLSTLGVLSEDDLARLEPYVVPILLNTRGEEVGAIRVRLELRAA